MAGKGNTVPKPSQNRRRRNAVNEHTIVNDGEILGPDLPTGIDWPAPTVQWWHNWRTSAAAKMFHATDWDFLLDTAMLHAAFWGGRSDVASEIRIRVAKLGATHEDRLRLHINVEEPASEEGAEPAGKRKNAKPQGRRNLKVV